MRFCSDQTNKLMTSSLNQEDLRSTSCLQHSARPNRGATETFDEDVKLGKDRGLKMRKPSPLSSHRRMRYLWLQIVKTMLKELGLKVSPGALSGHIVDVLTNM
jgi:hypothetical protein